MRTLSTEKLLAAAQQGGDYLMRHAQADGQFDYLYSLATDTVLPEYNIVRHCGAIVALLDLYSVVQQPALLQTATQAIHYLLSYCKSASLNRLPCQIVTWDDKAELDANALAGLSLARYLQIAHSQPLLEWLQGLSRWMIVTQAQDGRFQVPKPLQDGRDTYNFTDGYYPGQVIYTLSLLHQLDKQPIWLRHAALAAHYYVDLRQQALAAGKPLHDHWLLYGLNQLQRLQPEQGYIDYARQAAAAIMNEQHSGGYGIPPQALTTAIRTEALVQAYRLLQDFNPRVKELAKIKSAINRGNVFQTKLQITEKLARQFPNPERALGAVCNQVEDLTVRIDYVQHCMASWLGQLRLAN